MMKKTLSLLAVLSILAGFSYGCASKEYVKQQIDPLVDRISKLEATTQSLKDCCGRADAAAERAEAAAKAAQEAAKKAQAAAEKSSKSFELLQKK
ncbi:MAG TPA: Lpp/OprI family alanine-zipper lipoprotein [Thermodesulfovibrionales bacterium]|nr:Lpp/OprI family alanine-zipper lipoprotein [Thermodesulfovibrionales bacterium]